VAQLNVEPDDLVDEVAAHLRLAKVKVDDFLATSTTQTVSDSVQEYLCSNNSLSSNNSTCALVIWGSSGSGKTFLMADAVKRAVEAASAISANVIIRFLGTTPRSSSARALMESITMQVCIPNHVRTYCRV
jgi:chromosomal replication initiation ATPase DnaA